MTRSIFKSPALAALALALATSTMAVAPASATKTSLNMGMVLQPPHLDPTAGAPAAIDEVVYSNVFEGLTRIDRNGAVQPGLAESWTVSDDGKTYTFQLRSGVKFHDGTDFDAEDAKFSLDRARAEGTENAQKALFTGIATVEVTDPATLVVTLTNPAGNFLFNLGWGDAVMVAPESADNNKTTPVGTGPVADAAIEKAVARAMDLTPRGLREHLSLNKPVYQRTAAYGHFGRAPDADGGFSWERTDLGDALKSGL